MSSQPQLRLQPAPMRETVELLHRTHDNVLVPLEEVRARYFRNLNPETFDERLRDGSVALPITTLHESRKALKFVHIHHLAALIDARAFRADETLAAAQEAS